MSAGAKIIIKWRMLKQGIKKIMEEDEPRI
jgi:hypothetical protein